ncbi:MAG: hemolysin family protein [Candidatus Aminicenantaceae bacterium]
MDIDTLQWVGLGLSLFSAFLFSLYHISLETSSKIAISRILEDKPYRSKILDIYDELKIAVGYMRSIFLIACLVYFFIVFPRLQLWPLWMLIFTLAVYILFFEFLPRLLNTYYKKRILLILLPSYKIPFALAKPILFLENIKSMEKDIDEQHEASEEEIDALIEEAEEEGIIEKNERELLKSVVEFGDTIVREIMTPRISMICIQNNVTIQKLRDLVIKEKHSRIPVYKESVDNIEGIVIAKDLLEYSEDIQKRDSIEPLLRPVFFIPESMKVAELLKELQERKQKIAIVVDEHGGVSGLVTMEDLMEEIVGEIQDEYDKEKVQFIKQGPFDYIVLGDAEVEELEDLFDIDLASDYYITVGGLITHHLGRFPLKGEKLDIKGLELEILDASQKNIKKLRVRKKDITLEKS